MAPRFPRILLDLGATVAHIPALRVVWYLSKSNRMIARPITVREDANAGSRSIGQIDSGSGRSTARQDRVMGDDVV